MQNKLLSGRKKLLAILISCIFITTYTVASELTQKNIEQLNDIFNIIKTHYITPAKSKLLVSGAIKGMTSALDKHSGYLDAAEQKKFRERIKGKHYGIGIVIDNHNGFIRVITVLDKSPAQKAGIKKGDYILAVNDHSLFDISLTEAIKKIAGSSQEKATIILTVNNKENRSAHKITVVRRYIQIKDISSRILADKFGYIYIHDFQHETNKRIIKEIEKLSQKAKDNLRGLILDLRDNMGVNLPQGIEMADIFVTKKSNDKSLGSIKLQKTTKHYYAKTKDILSGVPLIVIINEETASASEALAVALQENNRALILGKKSYGKGSVQKTFPNINAEGGAVRLTVGYYYTPSGRAVEKLGVVPDIVVDQLKVLKENEKLLFIRRMTAKNKESLNSLAQKDYQLYEALKLLKILHKIKTRKVIFS